MDKQAFTSAVEKFSLMHDRHQIDMTQKKYRDLIPLTTPGPGEQYAFEVDLDKCTGCKACVTACHNENGLDEDETWRSVGLIQGGTSTNPAIQHITTACHHCLDPACMNGCPTLAYKKDEATGIVKHLEDQCFGCQYCILKCPYEVPQYNKKRGIVHKCDMCIGRLEANQPPACVRACPNGAIRITLVSKAEVESNPSEYVKVPDAPASDYTYPTTKYITNRIFPDNMESVDYHAIKPEHAHMPLVVMLVLTQLSVGAFLVEKIINQFINPHFTHAFYLFHLPIALGIGLLALAASILHLGRPHLAFRAILGFKTSWLSKEIVAFSLFAGLAVLYSLAYWVDALKIFFTRLFFMNNPLPVLAGLVLGFGLIGIFCSIMVYKDTKRPFWDNDLTTAKFYMTTLILGSSMTLVTSILLGMVDPNISLLYMIQYIGTILCKAIISITCLKLLLEASLFLYLKQSHLSFFRKTAILMTRHLKSPTLWRFICGVSGGILIPVIFIQMNDLFSVNEKTYSSFIFLAVSLLILGLSLAGELLERYLFFKAVVPLKMPGATR